MAATAHLGGRFQAEGGSSGVRDIVDTVAIDAGWDIRILFGKQGCTVYAALVLSSNIAVTTGANIGNIRTPGRRKKIVGVMAVRANSRVFIACRPCLCVHTVHVLLSLLCVTLFACLRILSGELALILYFQFRMRISCDICMA